MDLRPPVRRRRETFLTLCLAVVAACFVALYFLLVAGQMFLALLVVLAGLAGLGCLQYLVWGRPMNRAAEESRRRAP